VLKFCCVDAWLCIILHIAGSQWDDAQGAGAGLSSVESASPAQFHASLWYLIWWRSHSDYCIANIDCVVLLVPGVNFERVISNCSATSVECLMIDCWRYWCWGWWRAKDNQDDLHGSGSTTSWCGEVRTSKEWWRWWKTDTNGERSWLAPTVLADHQIDYMRRSRINTM